MSTSASSSPMGPAQLKVEAPGVVMYRLPVFLVPTFLKVFLVVKVSAKAFARNGSRLVWMCRCLFPAAPFKRASVILVPGAVPGRSWQRSSRESLKSMERLASSSASAMTSASFPASALFAAFARILAFTTGVFVFFFLGFGLIARGFSAGRLRRAGMVRAPGPGRGGW